MSAFTQDKLEARLRAAQRLRGGARTATERVALSDLKPGDLVNDDGPAGFGWGVVLGVETIEPPSAHSRDQKYVALSWEVPGYGTASRTDAAWRLVTKATGGRRR